MRIDKPLCSFRNCRNCFDGNCIKSVEYDRCEYRHYEDLEEQGRLIELPCNIGDTVYCIVRKKIVCDVVDRIEINKSCKKISTKEHSWLCYFDKVFLTKAKAEKVLAEMERSYDEI